MNSLRKMFYLLTALGFAAFALPSIAAGPTKQYSLNMSPSTAPASGPFVVTAKFQNQTPSGNSTFNSLELILPAGSGLVIDQTITPTIQYATTANGSLQTATGTPTIITNGTGSTEQKIRISNINPPIKPNWVFVVTFTAIPTATCANINATWSAKVWTGSNFAGDTFLLLAGLSSLTTGGCDVVLSCTPGVFYNEPSVGGNTTSIERLDNKDESPCVPVAFNVTLLDQSRTVRIQWDEATYPTVVLRATVTWPFELTEESTSFPKRTTVAWEVLPPSDPNAGQPKYIPAPACISDQPPDLASTPMPVVTTGPYAGQRVRACLIDEIFVVQPPGTSGCPTPAPASAQSVGCVRVLSNFFITGDPWLSRQ